MKRRGIFGLVSALALNAVAKIPLPAVAAPTPKIGWETITPTDLEQTVEIRTWEYSGWIISQMVQQQAAREYETILGLGDTIRVSRLSNLTAVGIDYIKTGGGGTDG